MNLRKRNHKHIEVSTHSFSDIMFFLMLFFLIASTLVSPNVIKLLLPNAGSKKSMSKESVTLSVNTDKNYFIDNKFVAKENVKSTLMGISKTLTEPTIILKVDKTLPVQDLVELLDMGNELKIKMVLATQTAQQ
jgi:biopolymer transport protein ExbD